MSSLHDSLLSVGLTQDAANTLVDKWRSASVTLYPSSAEKQEQYTLAQGYSYLIERYGVGGTVKIGPLTSEIDRSARLKVWQTHLSAAQTALSEIPKLRARPLESVFVPIRFG